MNWDCIVKTPDPRTRRYFLRRNGAPLSYAHAVDAWRNDASFRSYFNGVLAAAPFEAYRWENPAAATRTADREFEFVLLDCPARVRPVDAEAFADRFAAARGDQSVSAFENLGKDAVLVVPHARGSDSVYVHLAAFVRGADERQQQELWRVVGTEMAKRLGDSPLWLSTAGMGVAWLHIRLDSRPKYYGFGPYIAHA